MSYDSLQTYFEHYKTKNDILSKTLGSFAEQQHKHIVMEKPIDMDFFTSDTDNIKQMKDNLQNEITGIV